MRANLPSWRVPLGDVWFIALTMDCCEGLEDSVRIIRSVGPCVQDLATDCSGRAPCVGRMQAEHPIISRSVLQSDTLPTPPSPLDSFWPRPALLDV